MASLSQSEKLEIKKRARDLVNQAERAIKDSAGCGVLGDVGTTLENWFRSSGSDEPESVCDRQKRSLANLRLTLTQLEDACYSQFDQSERILTLADSIAEDAKGLVDETDLASWREFLRAYGRQIGSAVGTVAAGAADVATGTVAGLFQGLGPAWTLILLYAAATYFFPKRGEG